MTNDMNPQPPQQPPVPKKSALGPILIGCAVFIVIAGIVAAGIAWWGYHKAKTYVEKETGGDSMKVAQLWPDVPRMDGMDQSNQIDMPIALKLVAKPFMNTMMRGVNNGKEAGSWDWTAFSLPGKTPTDLQAFYTAERMQTNGWKQEGGCSPLSAGPSGQATMCAFQKQEGQKATGLIIIAADDQEHKAASIFFIRQEGTADTTSKP